MDVSTAVLNTDVDQAREKWVEYRDQVRRGQATSAEELAARAFRQMAFGRQVIDLNLAITSGGLYANRGLPKLAIARAHWPFVYAWWSGSRVVFTRGPRKWSTRGEGQQMRYNPHVLFSPRPARMDESRAQVPSIPPALRPEGGPKILERYHILFEAVWEPEPPADPLLLSHLGGPFYVVRAHWELTPLERALLRDML